MPDFTITLAANVRCYRSGHVMRANSLEDLLANLRDEASTGLHATMKPDWETMSGETALDITDEHGVQVADDVMLDGTEDEPSASDITDAAMCLWEAVLEYDLWASTQMHTREKREFCAKIARECHLGWMIAHADGDGFDDGFDWEFVPWFLRQCVAQGDMGVCLRTDWRETCAALRDQYIRDRAIKAAAAARAAQVADEAVPPTAWMLMLERVGDQTDATVWAFDDIQEHQKAMDICNARGLRFMVMQAHCSKSVAALLELSGGMHEAAELEHCLTEHGL
jgi:hypothetical protein